MRIATYNLLDLFDPGDAPKIAALAEVVRALDADVIAFQEVGSEAALRAVLAAAGGAWLDPIVGRADKRGIACAIASKRPIRSHSALDATTLPFPVLHEGDPAPFGDRLRLRRAIPVARIDGGDLGELHVLSLHWKSGRPSPLVLADGSEREPATAAERAEGDLRSLIQRSAEALFLRHAVDEILRADPEARVAVCGDYNDVNGSVPLNIACGDGDTALTDVVVLVPPEGRVSVLHGGSPAAIDHVLLSAALAERVQTARFVNAGLKDPDALPPGTPVLPSDHAPLLVTLA